MITSSYWSTWQTCGVTLSRPLLGVVGKLVNRASVTYWNSWNSVAPATFYVMDMSGTYAAAMHQWTNLSQFAYPGLGTTFSAGYVQASGTLRTTLVQEIFSQYVVSRLVVTTSGTYCQ